MSAFRVGVTGGIGSGKTALTDHLASFGVPIVDADVVAREVVEPGTDALRAISEHFGDAVIDENGALIRPALRKIVFESPAERKWLEALTHPLIRDRIEEQLKAADFPYAVLSSPLLLESSQADFVEHVVVVDVPESVQLERTMARDANSEALVKSIMKAQLDRTARVSRADSIIDNSGSLDDLLRAGSTLHEQLLELAAARTGGGNVPG